MSEKYILVIDLGTSGARGGIYNEKGKMITFDYEEYEQFYPQSGWWEQSSQTIWEKTLKTSRTAIKKAGLTGSDLCAIGITNQRETTTLWDKTTGKGVTNSIVWGCRRSAEICDTLFDKGYGPIFNQKTGLVLDPIYSGTKIRWVLDTIPGAQEKAARGDLLFGTIDTWLLWNLTKGAVHATDYSNAARTLLYNAYDLCWDDELMEILALPKSLFPEVKDSVGLFGMADPEWFGASIPITGIAGDQSSALFGQACFDEGSAKNTYGTGAVPLMFTGDKASVTEKGLLTVAWGLNNTVKYSMGASILIAGQLVQWLRDKMRFVEKSSDTEAMAASLSDNGDLYFVPAFTGLGAPHWNSGARGMLIGITAATSREQIVRASLESMAYQTKDLLVEMERCSGVKLKELKVDGGAAENDFIMQFQADLLGCDVIRPKDIETTSLGACYLAGLGCGIWNDQNEIRALWEVERVFTPQIGEDERQELYSKWCKAVDKSKDWL
ncbi:MAG: glycerol kinase GlpK [Eubacterium sp.]